MSNQKAVLPHEQQYNLIFYFVWKTYFKSNTSLDETLFFEKRFKVQPCRFLPFLPRWIRARIMPPNVLEKDRNSFVLLVA